MYLDTPTLLWLISYIIPQVLMAVRKVPYLKKKYDANWALITGAGTGIGRAIDFKVASHEN